MISGLTTSCNLGSGLVLCSPKSLSWQMEVSYLIALLLVLALAYLSEYACSRIYGASFVVYAICFELPPTCYLAPSANGLDSHAHTLRLLRCRVLLNHRPYCR